jgi:hypothetical protein
MFQMARSPSTIARHRSRPPISSITACCPHEVKLLRMLTDRAAIVTPVTLVQTPHPR